jgi:SAM-dependent methyltransferase
MARLDRSAAKPPEVDATLAGALRRLAGVPARRALLEAAAHLGGPGSALLAGVAVASERSPGREAIDGRLLEALLARALAGARGALFTHSDEGRLLAAFALAAAAARRGGPAVPSGVAALLGGAPAPPSLLPSLDGLRVLDPACGGGSLLAAAEMLAFRAGARLRLLGLDLSPLATLAASLRLDLLGAEHDVKRGDALAREWPACDLVLMNPPFLRHEALPAAWKARAVRRSGLSRQADLSAHLVLLALRHAPVCGLVLPRALDTSRSAAPVRAEALARGGFALSLRSRAAGSFAASVETSLAVWVEGGMDRPAAEASVALDRLSPDELSALAAGRGGRRIRLVRAAPAPRSSGLRVRDVCDVRFGMKTGANGFFHLRPLGGDRYESAMCGEVRLAPGDVAPLLSGLRDAIAPELARPGRVIFRPDEPSPAARAYIRRGQSLGVDVRPTCASRRTWWQVAPDRSPAPVLYPAKVGTRAFAFHNLDGLLEDKKWHALFPRGVEPWLLALLLSSTPVRLAVERGARQLTGAQAIADIDCGVLAAAPFPQLAALRPLLPALRRLHAALARDPVTTDLAAMLDRPAQRELDRLAGKALGMSAKTVERDRRDLVILSAERLARAAQVREAIRRRA